MKKKVWVYEWNGRVIYFTEDWKENKDVVGYKFLGTTEIEITPEVKTVRREYHYADWKEYCRSNDSDITESKNIKISYDIQEEVK